MTPRTLRALVNQELTKRYSPGNRAHARQPQSGRRVAIGQGTSYNSCVPEFRILGPLEVTTDDGTRIDLGGAHQRALLAALLLRAGKVVSREFLIDALWGEQAPATARQSLHNAASQLRRALGEDVILSTPPGYVAAVRPNDVDLGRFERLAGEARSPPAEERAAVLARRSTSGAANRSAMCCSKAWRARRSTGSRSCGSPPWRATSKWSSGG
jgi:hypothetical protein